MLKCGAKKVGAAGLYDKAQGEFCIITITIKNIGDESQIFDRWSCTTRRCPAGVTVSLV